MRGWRIGRYEVLLFFHVVGATVWIGLGIAGHAVLVWADRSGEHVFATTFQRAVEWIEPPAIFAGPLLLLGTGVGLVLDGPWRWGDTWIVVGLSGYGAALALGAGFQMRVGRRYSALVAERGPEDRDAITLGRRLTALMWLELGILAVVLLSMTTKPTGGGSPDYWAIVVAVLAGAGWLTARGYRSASERLPEVPEATPRG